MSFAELFLALMLLVGPHPGKTLYSQTPVDESSPWVTVQTFEVDGQKVSAYRTIDKDDDADVKRDYACKQAGNPACRKPRYDKTLKRWQRPETWSEGLKRYWQISQHAGAVAESRAALEFLYVIVKHESGNGRRDVHEGTNHRPYRRRTKHEDAGKSWCLGQIMLTRHPGTNLPDAKFKEREAGDLVGLDDAATQLCLGVVADRVHRIMRRCKKRSKVVTPACVFLGYAGSVESADHPLIKERIASWMKVKRLRGKSKLGADVRKVLGLEREEKTPRSSLMPSSLSLWQWLPLSWRF